MARAGESVELASRDVTIHRLDLVDWDGSDPDRPIAIARRRVLRRHVHPGARPRPRRGGRQRGVPRRARAGPRAARSGSTRRSRSSASARRPPTGPDALGALLLPDRRRASTSLPELVVTDGEVAAISRGQFIRAAAAARATPEPRSASATRPGGSSRSRPSATAGWRRTRSWSTRSRRLGPRMSDGGRSRSSAGSRRLRAEHGPLFAVIGVFDGIHLGHRYLLGHLVDEAARPRRPAGGDHVRLPSRTRSSSAPRRRCSSTRPSGSGCSARPASRSSSSSTSTPRCARPSTTSSSTGSRRGRGSPGLLMTPGRGVRPRPPRDAGRGRARSAQRDGFDLVVVPPFALDGRSVRSSDIRAAIAAGDLETAERLLGRPYAVVGEAGCRRSAPVRHAGRSPAGRAPSPAVSRGRLGDAVDAGGRHDSGSMRRRRGTATADDVRARQSRSVRMRVRRRTRIASRRRRIARA